LPFHFVVVDILFISRKDTYCLPNMCFVWYCILYWREQ